MNVFDKPKENESDSIKQLLFWYSFKIKLLEIAN